MPASNRPSRPPVVLIAYSHDWSARSLESVLSQHGYAVLRAATGARVFELARIANPDAYILDHGPDIAGINICTRLREENTIAPNVPVIVTTSSIGSRTERIEAYAAGAWELCTEPLDIEIMLLKLGAFIQAKLAADRIRDETLVDAESGLYNARGLARRAREIGGEAVRRSDAVACIAFSAEPDVDAMAVSFEEESQIAEVVGRVCRTMGRVSDAVGRLGPKEYGIIAPATSGAGADRLLERLRDSFAGTTLRLGNRDRRFRVSASVAVAPNLADSSVDAFELLYSATTALRQVRAAEAHSDRPAQTAS